MATRIPNNVRSAACNAVVDLLDAGSAAAYVEIRTGAQPGSANDAATGTVLASITLNDPAFGSASNGVATADVSPAIVDSTADATGSAGWFRAYDSDDNTVLDGSCSLSGGGGDMVLGSLWIEAGVAVEIVSWTVTMPSG